MTDLLVSKGFDAIITVVDQLTKMAHFLPWKSITSHEVVDLVMREVLRHHGLPDDVISDRGPQFISKFSKHMFKLLRILAKLSSGYHPETNGQSDHTNQTLEKYLRCFINYQQDDWVDFLHLAEFAYNNSIHSSTGYSPFFANTDCHPRWMMTAHPEVPTNPAIEDRLSHLQTVHATILHNLHNAQVTHKRLVDHHRLDSSKMFRVGDHVWLLHHNIKTTRPCAKLDYQRFGPYMITRKISDVAFRLGLPPHTHLHPMSCVSRLEPYTTSSIPGRLTNPPPPVEFWEGPEFEVVAILDSKIMCNKLYYLVDWVVNTPND